MTEPDEHEGKGGSYVRDPHTGKRTLIERTDDSVRGATADALAMDSLGLAEQVLKIHRLPQSDAARADEKAFGKWWAEFSRNTKGRRVLKQFDAKRLAVRKRTAASVQNDLLALYRIARACYSAVEWKRANDPGVRYRGEITKVRRLKKKLAYHARELARGLKGNPPGLMWALWRAELKAWVGWVDLVKVYARAKRLAKVPAMRERFAKLHAEANSRSKDRRERQACDMWSEFFDALSENLKGKLPEIDGGPWLHRSTYGNLIYQKDAPKKPPALETMLAFELAMYLRLWSAGRARDVVQNGQPMPKDGKPHFPLSAAFTSAALDLRSAVGGEAIANRLKRMPLGVGLFMWERNRVERPPR